MSEGASEIALDYALPFSLGEGGVRGRIVRLGPAAERAISGHSYTAAPARLAGEALVLVSLIGSALKFDGTLTLQTRGDGTAKMVVADYVTPGLIRAMVQMQPGAEPDAPLLGRGSFALTIDPDEGENRYQGIVELDGSLADAARAYFANSEQIPTALKIAVGQVQTAEMAAPQWRAGGLIIQRVAIEGGLEPGGARDEDLWNRAVALADTTGADELLDPLVSAETLAYRLFHEDQVRGFPRHPIRFGCRCSQERVDQIFRSYGPEALADLRDTDGAVRMTCEFCGAVYVADESAGG